MRVLITGATGGIGGEALRQLRAAGHDVVGLDLRADDALGVLGCDVRDQDAVDTAVAAAVERLGGLDVVCNVSGLGLVQDTGEAPGAGAVAVLDVNLTGMWRVTGAAVPHLLRSTQGPGGRGRVVCVASVLSANTIPFAAAYCASKAGIVAWARCLRHEYGTVLSVVTMHPGYVRTAIHDDSQRHGIGLEGTIPADSLEATGAALVRACVDPRAPRQVVTNALGRVSLLMGQHAPALTDRLVAVSMRRQLRKPEHSGDPMVVGMAARLTTPRIG